MSQHQIILFVYPQFQQKSLKSLKISFKGNEGPTLFECIATTVQERIISAPLYRSAHKVFTNFLWSWESQTSPRDPVKLG